MATQEDTADVEFKVLILGDAGVGKSSLLIRFTSGRFPEAYESNIGVDFLRRNVNVRGKTVALKIWDTAGQERFRHITSSYFRGAQGMLIVYDVTDPLSFENVEHWIESANRYTTNRICRMLVGNKIDLLETAEESVPVEKAREVASKHSMSLFQTSAKEGTAIDEPFLNLADELLSMIQPDKTDNSSKSSDTLRLKAQIPDRKKKRCYI